jgi:DNA adenine methylase
MRQKGTWAWVCRKRLSNSGVKSCGGGKAVRTKNGGFGTLALLELTPPVMAIPPELLDNIAIFDDNQSMPYPGGKNGSGVYQTIINLMPPHEVYIEPFLGAGAIMRLKRPATKNIGIDRDPEALKHFRDPTAINGDTAGITIINGDALDFLTTYPFTGKELVYCDPPYLHSTRNSLDLYRYELSEADHSRLLAIIKTLPCMVLISGYYSTLYADALRSWNTASFQAITRGGTIATEWLWYNYPTPVALHDYRYLGEDFRERERIKRKKQRWVNRLRTMPILERRALLAAISEAWPISHR